MKCFRVPATGSHTDAAQRVTIPSNAGPHLLLSLVIVGGGLKKEQEWKSSQIDDLGRPLAKHL